MNTTDKCPVCDKGMEIKSWWWGPAISFVGQDTVESEMTCPSCGVLIDSKREYSRRVYKKYDEKDRFLIGEAIRKGEDWRAVA